MSKLTEGDIAELHQATVEAEKSLLGSILMSGSSPEPIRVILNREDFHDAHWKTGNQDRHARIFEAMARCPNPHQVAVAQELARIGKLKSGDCAYLCDLVMWCLDYHSYLDWEEYAQAVRNYSKQRQIEYANRTGNKKRLHDLVAEEHRGGVELGDVQL